jgi:hypothetical protein
MSAFSVAWQLLKSRYSEKDILDFKEKLRREAESGYASDRGQTSIEHLMGMKGLGQQYFPFELADPTTSGMHDLNSRDSNIERRKFERGYKDRMNPKPVSRPTKVRLTGDGHSLGADLVDDDNNLYSSLGGTPRGQGPQNFEMTDLSGDTVRGHQRQGHYGNLMNTLLQHGIGIHSNNRSSMSQPFHRKFQQNLAPNINFSGSNENDEDVDYSYSRKPNIESPEGWGSLQPDYGQYPLVNEAQLRERREPHQPIRQSKLTEEQFNPVQETSTEYTNKIPPEYQELLELFG